MITGLRRDGHLTDLALEHVLDDAPLAATADHLAACEACQARLQAARDADLPLPAFLPNAVAAGPATPSAANRPWMWAGVVLAAAAALFVALPVLQQPPDDGIRVKGAGLQMQVYRDEGGRSARLKNHDEVKPGDRLGFRVRHRSDGWLMIIGIDSADAAYLCYPQSMGGDAEPVRGGLEPRALPEAVRLDDTLGDENLVAVLCDAPFDFDTLAPTLDGGVLPEGCVTDRIVLEKH